MAIVDINFWEMIWEAIKAAVVGAYFFLALEVKIFWPWIKPLIVFIAFLLAIIIIVILFEKPWRKVKKF